MQYSIDVDLGNKAICGWVAESNEPATVELHSRDKKIGSMRSDLYRSDVKKLKLHASGYCGFAFLERNTSLSPGNIYQLKVATSNGERFFYRLYGEQAALLQEFVSFELLPRDDLRFLEGSPEDIYARNSDLIAYKTLMIRLRRGKRGKSCRGSFVGFDYPHKEIDFAYFKRATESNLPFWLGFLDARYLWSLVDTYADYGSREERLAALALSNYMYMERFFQTRRCVFDESIRAENDRVISRQLEYWGGMKTNQLAADDALDVFLTRNIEILDCVPVVKAIFFEILNRSASEPNSGLGFNLSQSVFFTKVFAYYKKQLKLD